MWLESGWEIYLLNNDSPNKYTKKLDILVSLNKQGVTDGDKLFLRHGTQNSSNLPVYSCSSVVSRLVAVLLQDCDILLKGLKYDKVKNLANRAAG